MLLEVFLRLVDSGKYVMKDDKLKEPAPPSGITSEQAGKILKADIANMVRKVTSGRTLSTTERAIVRSVADGESVPADGWAKNQVELAAALGVNRRTVARWRKVEGNPGCESDGRMNVGVWREWAKRQGHKFDEEDDKRLNKGRLEAERLLKLNTLLDLKIKEVRGELISVATVEGMLSELGATIVALLRQKLENEWPISCAGLEPAQIRVRGKAMVDDICGRLQKAVEPWEKKQ